MSHTLHFRLGSTLIPIYSGFGIRENFLQKITGLCLPIFFCRGGRVEIGLRISFSGWVFGSVTALIHGLVSPHLNNHLKRQLYLSPGQPYRDEVARSLHLILSFIYVVLSPCSVGTYTGSPHPLAQLTRVSLAISGPRAISGGFRGVSFGASFWAHLGLSFLNI